MRRRLLIISCSSLVGIALILLAILSTLPIITSDPTLQPTSPTQPFNIAFYPLPNNFVLYIGGDTAYFLDEFELRPDLDGQQISIPITDAFTVFERTNGVAVPGACYMFGEENSASGFPDICPNLDLNFYTNSDNFWWDDESGKRRSITIGRVGEPPLRICNEWQPTCTFLLDATPFTEVVTAPTSEVVTSPTVTLSVPTPNPTTSLSNDDWQPMTQIFRGVEFVLVPEGCYMMGSTSEQLDSVFNLCLQYEPTCSLDWYTDETPAHQQCFDEPFWITRYEITNDEYGGVGVYTGETRPREFVSLEMATGYCERRGWRLPTEAEWEYAARGPDNLIFPYDNIFDSFLTVFSGNSRSRTAAVDSQTNRNQSWVGAYHMSGNVWEWTSSFYAPYPYDAADGRENNQDTTSNRVVRGGSFVNDPMFQRTTQRLEWRPSDRNGGIGFRCVRAVEDGDVSGQ